MGGENEENMALVTIFKNNNIIPGLADRSKQEVINHEMRQATDIKLGKLSLKTIIL